MPRGSTTAHASPSDPVRLGPIGERSVTATVYGLVHRGALLRPDLAREVRGCVLIRFSGEEHAPVRVTASETGILVEDDALADPPPELRIADLEIHASLHDLVLLAVAPLVKGMPKPTDRRGRAALARIADGRVDFLGSLGLARRFLRLLSVAPEG